MQYSFADFEGFDFDDTHETVKFHGEPIDPGDPFTAIALELYRQDRLSVRRRLQNPQGRTFNVSFRRRPGQIRV